MAPQKEDKPDYDEEIIYETGPLEKFFHLLTKFLKNITVEPVVFFYSLGFSITMLPSANLYFDKTCKVGSVIFGNGSTYHDDICDNLDNGDFDDVQEYVQKTVATIQLVTLFVKGIPPIIFALFIGPWSDKFGRKFLIIFPLFGYVLYDLWFLVNVIYFDELVVEYLMLEIVQYWFGGFMCMFLGLYAYISDVSPEGSRTARIAIMDFVFFAGIAIGKGVAGIILTTYGYEVIYGAAAIMNVLAILYALFFVTESDKIRIEKGMPSYKAKDGQKPTLGSMFNFNRLKESFQVAFKRREGGLRHVIVICLSLFGMYSIANNSLSPVNIPYAKAKFEWKNGTDSFSEEYAKVDSIGVVFNLFAIGVLMPIMTQILKLSDLTITAVCVFSSFSGIITIMLAENYLLLYLANFLRMFSDVTTVGIRSALTKLVGSSDTGKVFACVGAIQAIVGFLSPIYNLIYRATYDIYIGFVYGLSCSILAIMFCFTMYVNLYMRKYDKRRKIKEESDSEQTETSSNSSSKENSKLPTYNETSDETKL